MTNAGSIRKAEMRTVIEKILMDVERIKQEGSFFGEQEVKVSVNERGRLIWVHIIGAGLIREQPSAIPRYVDTQQLLSFEKALQEALAALDREEKRIDWRLSSATREEEKYSKRAVCIEFKVSIMTKY